MHNDRRIITSQGCPRSPLMTAYHLQRAHSSKNHHFPGMSTLSTLDGAPSIHHQVCDHNHRKVITSPRTSEPALTMGQQLVQGNVLLRLYEKSQVACLPPCHPHLPELSKFFSTLPTYSIICPVCKYNREKFKKLDDRFGKPITVARV